LAGGDALSMNLVRTTIAGTTSSSRSNPMTRKIGISILSSRRRNSWERDRIRPNHYTKKLQQTIVTEAAPDPFKSRAICKEGKYIASAEQGRLAGVYDHCHLDDHLSPANETSHADPRTHPEVYAPFL